MSALLLVSSDPRRQAVRRTRRFAGLILAALCTATAPAFAQAPLPDLSIEDLMKLDSGQVFGASERLQPVTEAPASVSFITAAEISRFGYRSLADILRSVRGLYVTDDRNFSYIGARGFSKPGDYNSRILLLINGHRVNDNVFGQAEIGAEFGLDTATIERVEVIRGPASSLYGDSAFFAVVNVITRPAASFNGGAVILEAGTLGTRLTRARMGHRFGNGLELALSGTYSQSDGVERLYFPAFDAPGTNNGVAENLDAEGVRQFYSRIDFRGLAVTAAYGARRREVPTASFGTLFNFHDPEEQTTDRHTLLDAEYGRSYNGTRVTFRGSFDRFSYDGLYPYPGDETSALIVGHNTVLGSRWTAGVRATRQLPGRQTITAGAEFIDNFQQDQTSRILNPPSVPLDLDRASTQHAAYLQDEIRFFRWLIVNGGLRYDGYDEFERLTPRAALIVMPSSTQSFKYLFGQAFRAPNEYELNAFYFGQEAARLRPESIDTHELVWERYTNDWLRTSVSGYWYRADRLITLVPGSDGFFGVTYVNEGEVRARGLELEAQMRLPAGAHAQASYSLQRAMDRETDAELPNSPRHMAKARVAVPWPTRSSSVGLEGLFMSSRATLGGGRVGAATTVNLTALHSLSPRWELFATVRNLFDAKYADPASSQHLQDSIEQNGRTVRIGLKWNMWIK